ncbi:MAG TPA: isochorismatase family cysteine hydrolase [Longimicrobiaceae bacterium]|nr:isochorismatase family cysteine hydrolase [Longimicrobiaceae bacterium]
MPADAPGKDPDLNGSAPDTSPVALVLIDVINDMEFEGGEKLFELALPAAKEIAALKRSAQACGIPVVYCNDNFGRWRADFHEVVAHCLQEGVRGRPIAELLHPDDDDYFVLKPKHSAFYATTFDLLLDYLETRTLVMAGFSGDVCVQLSAADAFLRDLKLYVPADCTASITREYNDRALAYMRRVLDVDTTPWRDLDLEALGRK